MTRYGVTSFEESIYDAAHGFINPETGEKGVASLARLTGRNPTTLTKKIDPFIETHLVNTEELIMIIKETKKYSIIKALASEFNHGVFPFPELGDETEKGILSAVLKAAVEGGEACKAIDDALKDDIIEAKEATKCAKEIDDQINALLTLRSRLIKKVVDPEHLPIALEL